MLSFFDGSKEVYERVQTAKSRRSPHPSKGLRPLHSCISGFSGTSKGPARFRRRVDILTLLVYSSNT